MKRFRQLPLALLMFASGTPILWTGDPAGAQQAPSEPIPGLAEEPETQAPPEPVPDPADVPDFQGPPEPVPPEPEPDETGPDESGEAGSVPAEAGEDAAPPAEAGTDGAMPGEDAGTGPAPDSTGAEATGERQEESPVDGDAVRPAVPGSD